MTERSAPEVLQAIAGNLQNILRSEFLLARTEIREEAAEATRPATTIAVGLLFGGYAVGLLLMAGVYALTMVVAMWVAALVVSVAAGAVAVMLIARGRAGLRRINTHSETTIASLKGLFHGRESRPDSQAHRTATH